ncbi:hypothetical protein KR054_003013, partial [Drosophila jambulina]
MKDPVRRTSRNFLQENRLLVSQYPKEKSKARQNYDRTTIATLARTSGAHNAQRRPAGGTVRTKSFAEKQVQTEDISDERFLSAAMLKCSERGHFRPARSEGDEAELGEGESCGKSLSLRRIASSFELGRMPEQRDGYQSGQYTLPRPLSNGFGLLPSSCDQSSAGLPSSKSSTPRVRQMDIPEIVDVDLEESLSMRSQMSCDQAFHFPPEQPQEQELEELKPPQVEDQPKEQNQEQLQSESNLMTGELRIVLLEAARERQRQLIAEYNRLPISMGTLRVRNLKQLLEQQLDVVDNDVSVLS